MTPVLREQLPFIVIGVVSVAVGLPLAGRVVRPNRWYGLRIPATFADEHVWFEANALMGRDLVVLGVLLLAVMVLVPGIVALPPAMMALLGGLVFGTGIVISLIRSVRFADRLLAARGDAAAVLDVERAFFGALHRGDRDQLEQVLAPDFLLIDVMRGGEVPRAGLLDLVGSGQLRFLSILPADTRVRRYGTAAVVTGRTEMRGRFGEQDFTVRSRYTHVYVRLGAAWQLAAAQGTPIADEFA